MDRSFKTEQEAFWAGQFGDAYSERNVGELLEASNAALFSKVLARCTKARTLIEFGSNIGLNLRAIRKLAPQMELDAIEINQTAVDQLNAWGGARKVHHSSILEFKVEQTWDIALIKGVLIHIDPESLSQVYDRLYQAAQRYIVVVEYYNPSPVEVLYRGHAKRLFKRDFAGEILDRYPTLRVVDYGFVWHRDPVFPQDDISWFVLERSDRCA